MSKNSTSTKSSAQQQQTGQSNQSFTPGNLSQLNNAWSGAANLFNNSSGNGVNLVNNGQNLVNSGATAATNAATGGLNTATDLANGGTANPANSYLTPFASGAMGTGNPYYQNTIDLMARALQPQVDGSFAASGRYGSGANANAFAGALTNEAGNLAYQDYGNSLDRQLNAAGQLSQNNATSTGQRINALDVINPLSGAAVNPGTTAINSGQAPALNYAQILAMLGGGGGTQSGNTSSNSTASGKQNTTSAGFNLSQMLNPVSLFSPGFSVFG